MPVAETNNSVVYDVDRTSIAEDTGILIRTLRKKAGLTQTKLARRLGVSQPVISKMENGKRPVGPRAVFKISFACGFEANMRFVSIHGTAGGSGPKQLSREMGENLLD